MSAFKYIKKKWQNGKWHYTYPDDTKQKSDKGVKTSKNSEKFKYIKKERVNGKWRYIYPEDEKKKSSEITKKTSNLLNKIKFKYIKKEWKNGKWVYTYPDDLKKSGLLDKVKDILGFDEKERSDSAKIMASGKVYINSHEELMKTTLRQDEQYKKAVYNSFNKIMEYRSEQINERLNIRVPELEQQRRRMLYTPGENPLPELLIKTNATTLDEDEKIINPNFNPENPDTSMNCAYCTIAYDLRRRGYDVKAIEQPSELNIYGIARLYENGRMNGIRDIYREAYDLRLSDFDSYDIEVAVTGLNKILLSYGNNARGNLCVYWLNGSGHSVSWEVENQKVTIRDAQINGKWDLLEYENWDYVDDIYFIRTDDLTPTKDVLKYVQNARKK